MLQVASAGDPDRHDGTLSAEEGRSHFGAWAIVSSPLTLGFSILDQAKMRLAWPVISNEEIIRVNQAYHGHPGRLVRAWSANGTLGDTAGGCADAQAGGADDTGHEPGGLLLRPRAHAEDPGLHRGTGEPRGPSAPPPGRIRTPPTTSLEPWTSIKSTL